MSKTLVAMLLVAHAAGAQSSPTPPGSLDSALRASTRPLRLVDGRLTGAGADSLLSAAERARFVLVGEEHGTVEIPRFVTALMRRLRPAGYRHLALEVGPLDANLLSRMPPGANPARWLMPYRTERGTRFAFYSEYADDAELVAAARADSVAIWGLDQSFILSSAMHLERLATLAPSVAARSVVLEHHRRDLAAALTDTGKRADGRFLQTATAADFATLGTLFQNAPAEADRILNELSASAAIYRANSEGRGTVANVARARLMKRHFWEYYQGSSPNGDAPKVLFKLGGVHAGRGINAFGVYPIGNTISELAELEGSSSLHIGYWSADQALLPLLRGLPDDSWAVLDLRTLRPLLVRAERAGTPYDPSLTATAKRYDALIIAPSLTRSSILRADAAAR